MNRRLLPALCIGTMLLPAASLVAAQPFPERPIRLVVPYPPGGGTDTLARPLAERLRQQLGQPVVIENRSGGATTIGMEHVARAAPDGHTLVINADSVALFPHLYSRLPYDLFRDFAHISFVASAPMVLGVNARVPIASVGELVEASRRQPERLRFANPSYGSPHHLAFELFAHEARIQVNSIDYRGAGPAMNDVIGGHVELGMFTLGVVLPHFQAGTIRPLVIMGTQRSALVPDVPTVAEVGLPNAQSTVRFFVAAPAATPPGIIARLNAAIHAVVADREFSAPLLRQGFEPAATSPQDTESGLRREQERWGPILRAANIRVD
jgi:tripartite-type tricarboxylate transporter receptor subunit TctC